MSGGKSYGSGFHDDGGSINITSGASLCGDGGNVSIVSGLSDGKSSESLFCFESFQLTSHALKIYITNQITAGSHLRMFSAIAGTSGVSGDMSFGTGIATSRFDFNHDGHSGAISMTTGSTRGIGRGGDISLRVGTGNMADGGDIFITAGNATGNTFIGGSLNLHSVRHVLCTVT